MFSQIHGTVSASTQRLDAGWSELLSVPSQNSTLFSQRSGPSQPLTVLKRKVSHDPVRPRASARFFRMKETCASVSSWQFATRWLPSGPYARACMI
ncbi:hypothetical protein T11_16766 [Trichinella zimbabwensis]|uniref:Uncharacterized protein n=1 Tax=Trichinella zimbabwensis TaxID=268475 RepID=A0A0V1HDR4_9BILA|nr:hypothetical protein T11_16766 [Trichinella zimbabwensis]